MNSLLTQQQQKAVSTIFGPIMVIAGPGTGKTQVLSARISNILKTTDTGPGSILALTFTESGVRAMRNRLSEMIGTDAYYVEIHTFHSFALKVINEFDEKFIDTADFTVATPLEKIEILREILEKNTYRNLKILDDPYFYIRKIEKAISVLKRENISWEKLIELAEIEKIKAELDPSVQYKKTGLPKPRELEKIKKIYEKQLELSDIFKKYEASLKQKKKRDFDDIIIQLVEKLQNDDDLRFSLQEKYLFILVDEYQDTNNAQNEIIKGLISDVDAPNIFIVGDDDQSIYRFQGASLSNILGFENDLPYVEKVVLTDNFRSTQTILNAAEDVVKNNVNRLSNIIEGLEKSFKSNTKYPEEKIDVIEFADNRLESFYITKKIQELISKGVKNSEIAVIGRKNSDLSDIAEELDILEIPFIISKDANVLDDPDIRKLITLLRVINDPNDDLFFYACANLSLFEIPIIEILEVRRDAKAKGKTIFEYLCESEVTNHLAEFRDKLTNWSKLSFNFPFTIFFSQLLKDINFIDYLMESPKKIEKIMSLNSVFEIVKQKNYENIDFGLSDFLNYIDILYSYNISIPQDTLKTDVDSVQLMTAHSSKGLEFEYVFIIKCYDKNWGNNQSPADINLPAEIISNSLTDKKEKNEDERRLFYVALTRAKKKLIITYPSKVSTNNNSRVCTPSMFVSEIREELKAHPDPSEYEKDILHHIVEKIEFVPKTTNDEKRYLNDLLDNYVLNATAFNTYLECSEKFKLNSLYRLPSVKTVRLSFGSAMHKALENFYDALKRGPLPNVEELQKYFELALGNEILQPDEKQILLEKGRQSLEGYYSKYQEHFKPALYTELDFKKRNVRFEGIQLTGKLDRVDILNVDNKTVKVIDYKTGRAKSKNEIEGNTKAKDEKYKNQLLFYKLLIDSDKSFGYKAQEAELDFIEGKDSKFQKVSFIYDEEQMIGFKELVRNTVARMKAQEFIKTTDYSLCEDCAFKKVCWGG